MEARERIIFALDVPNIGSAVPILDAFSERLSLVKVGLELFIAEGPASVLELSHWKVSVMLDLKLHDIPETVRRAACSAARLKPKFLTVHVGGGFDMLDAAVEGAACIERQESGHSAKILAVTVLTSLKSADIEQTGVKVVSDLPQLILERAKLAMRAGCHGVVAPVSSARDIRTAAIAEGRPDFLIVTPGISLNGKPNATQKNVGTAEDAIASGADYVVIGRDLRDAEDKPARIAAFAEQIERGLAARASEGGAS